MYASSVCFHEVEHGDGIVNVDRDVGISSLAILIYALDASGMAKE